MHSLTRVLSHDWLIIVLALVNLLAIGVHLGVGPVRQEGAGYRVIDTAAVRRLMDAGDLSGREADWYHPTQPEETVPAGEALK